jgi:hypothetical protein
MTFKLVQQKSAKANAVFRTVDAGGTTVGSVNVPHAQADDLVRHWRGGVGAPSAKPALPRVALPQLSKRAILRGC